MRLLANENFPYDAVMALRKDGHDVVWIRTESPGSLDEDILARARRESRVLVTFDKDFGELAFRSKLPASCGIILFRITPRSPEFVARLTTRAIGSRNDWVGHFAVIEEHRVRMRPLPEA
jgi:predicted nuclease of predicted toxin-antitoxin system